MRVLLSWLKDFTPLPAHPSDRASIDAVRTVLDSLGLVVEETEYVGDGLSDIVLARVLEINAIPKADRIRQVFVDRGDGNRLEIVCGAMNFVVGDVVPLAPVGAVLPGGMEIALRKMRGVTSNGMLCSGHELELADDADGLMILASTGSGDAPLPDGMQLGMKLTAFLQLEPDVVFDVSVEPNRPDCLSVIGIARDLAARLRLPFNVSEPAITVTGPDVASLANLSVSVPQCRRFVARVLQGISDVPTLPFVAERLERCGMRSISAMVDVSNYVMLELGQPSHPYDLDTLGGAGITVRFAHRGETLETLDGEQRVLGVTTDPFGKETDAPDLLICDAADTPVGLAGVMGGAVTEIRGTTRNVLIEVADFDQLTIGRTAARLDLRSEASARFWRGIDAAQLERAANRICELIIAAHVAAGVPAPQVANGVLDSSPAPIAPTQIHLRPERLNALLGTNLSTDVIIGHLHPIGFTSVADGDALIVDVPTYRPDATREVDVIEEVARQYGYENIPRTARRSPYVGQLGDTQRKRRITRRLLMGIGAHEAWTSSIVDPDGPAGNSDVAIELTHPIVPKERALRVNLLSGLLGAVAYNTNHRNGDIRLFEIGHVFAKGATAHAAPKESEQLAAIFAEYGDDAYAATDALDLVLEGLGIASRTVFLAQASDGVRVAEYPIALGMHPTRSALVQVNGDTIGAVGEVDPDVAAAYGLEGRRVGWLVLDIDQLFGLPMHTPDVNVVSRFPSSDVDLSFVVKDGVSTQALQHVLEDACGDLCEFVRLVDIYRDDTLGSHRSLAYRLRFCATDRTLTDSEIADLRSRAIDAAAKELEATLRS